MNGCLWIVVYVSCIKIKIQNVFQNIHLYCTLTKIPWIFMNCVPFCSLWEAQMTGQLHFCKCHYPVIFCIHFDAHFENLSIFMLAKKQVLWISLRIRLLRAKELRFLPSKMLLSIFPPTTTCRKLHDWHMRKPLNENELILTHWLR